MVDELVSVIIPVYNVELYLEKCVESVLNQTYSNLEIILVNDGSTDNSPEICERYRNIDKRIRVINKENGGLSDARNKGIDMATGKYITFIDSDDYVENNYVEYLYNLILKYKTDISICSHKLEIRNKCLDISNENREFLFTTEECLENMLNENGFSVSAWAKMYKTQLFEDVKFPLGKLCEDNGTTYKLVCKCKNIAFGNLANYIYVIREDSIMNSKFSQKKLDLIELTDEMAESLLIEHHSIRDTIIRRKMQARFSVLRQIVYSKEKEDKILAKKIRLELITNYKIEFFKNGKLKLRDRIAFLSLIIGLEFYKFSWNIYLKIKEKGRIL